MPTLLSSNPREKQTDNTPLYYQLKKLLKQDIQDEFSSNQKFYSVRQLVERHDVSTTTAVRALRELVDDGLLYSKRGKGMFISPKTSGNLSAKNEYDGVVISIPSSREFIEANKEQDAIQSEYRRGILDFANENGVIVQYQSIPREKAGEFNYYLINNIADNNLAQGVILYGSTEYDFPDILNLAIKRQVPYVAHQPERALSWKEIDKKNIHYVTTNQQGGLRYATEHLLKLGHTRIAYWEHKHTAFTRLLGFKEAMNKENVAIDEFLIERNFDFSSSCVSALQKLINSGVTALVTASDHIAMQVLREAKQAGISIPDELSVTGFDDNPELKNYDPALTTVSVDRYETGRQVTTALLKQMHHPENVNDRYQVMTPAELIVRNSTKRYNG